MAMVRSPSPSSAHSPTASPISPASTIDIRWKQRESVLSQQSSLYPPSTVTSASAFSGPETPPELVHSTDLPLLDVDDVDYRLKLLVKNSYYLPPVHQKPTSLQLTPSSVAPITSKPPTLKSLFRTTKSPKTPSTPQIPLHSHHTHSHHHHHHTNVNPLAHTHLGPPSASSAKSRNTRPQNRVVVIRETLPSLVPEPLPSTPPSEEPFHHVEALVDPTTDVDGAAAAITPTPPTQSPEQYQTGQGDWRTDLLHQAVGLSFINLPVRNDSLPAPAAPLPYGQPISTGVNNIVSGVVPVSREFKSPKVVDSQLQIAALRSPKLDNGAQSTALKPPPRPVRDRSRTTDESPNISSSSPHSSNGGGNSSPLLHQDPSFRDGSPLHENAFPIGQRAERDMDLMSPEPMLIRPSFSQSPRPSFASPPPLSPPLHSGPYPYSSSPFGLPSSLQPPRHSAATDHTVSTTTLHYSDHGHEHERYSASRPSMTASSVQSAPRPSISESHVSHYSATFGERSRDPRTRSSTSQSASRRSSLAYLRGGSRSRSLSPSGSRVASAYSANDAPPVPPLPGHSGSDTEGRSTRTVVYVHPTGALSNTALGPSASAAAVHRTGGSSNGHGSDVSPYLDPKRGITNVPQPSSPASPRFFGFIPPTFMSPKSKALTLPATVDVDIIMAEAPVDPTFEAAGESKAKSDDSHGSKQDAVENWRNALVLDEEVRRFDGMVIQHIESEKDRFKKIATRGREE